MPVFRWRSDKRAENCSMRRRVPPKCNSMTNLFKLCALGYLAWPLAAVPAIAAAPSDANCIEDWSVAAGIVATEKLTPVEELSPVVGAALKGAIVRTLLCREDGKYVYRIVVRDRRGQFSRHKIDARQPAMRRPADAP